MPVHTHESSSNIFPDCRDIHVEEYYLKKIQIYKNEYTSTIALLEEEIKKTREQLIEVLKENKQHKRKIAEMETRVLFFKDRLKNRDKNG